MDTEMQRGILAKLPVFNPEWPGDALAAWFKAFAAVVAVIGEKAEPAETPAPAPPARAQAPSNGKRSTRPIGTTEAQKAIMRQVAERGGSNREAASAAGVPETAVSWYMRTFRKELGTARKPPAVAEAAVMPAPFRTNGDAGFADGEPDA